MFKQVYEFNRKFKLPLGDKDVISDNVEAQKYRVKFLLEEVTELQKAFDEGDKVGIFDALLDIVYVALGTAMFAGIDENKWKAGMNAVHAANMSKIRVLNPSESKRGSVYDVKKPDGWVAPEEKLSKILSSKNTPLFEDFERLDGISTDKLLTELVARGGHPGALANAALLCIKKSQDYNKVVSGEFDAHKVDRSVYFPFGTLSYAQMIHTKSQRFVSLAIKENDKMDKPNYEGLEDTALDIINYAGFFLDYNSQES